MHKGQMQIYILNFITVPNFGTSSMYESYIKMQNSKWCQYTVHETAFVS